MLLTPVFFLGEFHGLYSPWVHDGSNQQSLVRFSAFKHQSHPPAPLSPQQEVMSAVMVKLALQTINEFCFPLITILYKSLASVSL